MAPIGKTDPDGGSVVTVAVQLSVTVTLKSTTAESFVDSEFTITVLGQLITGDSLSVTITLNEQVEVFPDGSVAIEFTVVNPRGKTLPEG